MMNPNRGWSKATNPALFRNEWLDLKPEVARYELEYGSGTSKLNPYGEEYLNVAQFFREISSRFKLFSQLFSLKSISSSPIYFIPL